MDEYFAHEIEHNHGMADMKRMMIRPKKIFFYFILQVFFFISPSALWNSAWAKSESPATKNAAKQIDLVIKKSHLITLPSPSSRVSVVDPLVADLQVIDPKQIMLSGITTGNTSLVIWTEDGKTQMYEINVRLDIERIKQSLKKILPDETIDVIALEDGIALQGEVHKIENVDQAMEVAKAFTPKVMNMLKVPGIHQVLLKVKVAEVARSFQEDAGVNLYLTEQDMAAGSRLGGLMSGSFGDPTKKDLTFSDAVTLFFGLERGKVNGFIQALKSKGLVHILAEPNLIARSGESAEFLAGGEYPIPVVQGGNSNSITIEYKQFGVKLNFTPTVIGMDIVQLDITPEVSDLDFTRGVKVGGFQIPGLVTRRTHTNVQLKDGQTFAIAGLISQNRQKNSRKVPLVGDIPVLGGIFKGSEMSGKDTELLIMVTPNLIAPLEQSLENYSTPIDDSNAQQQKQPKVAPIQKNSIQSGSLPANGKAVEKNSETVKPEMKPANSPDKSSKAKTSSTGSIRKTASQNTKSSKNESETSATNLEAIKTHTSSPEQTKSAVSKSNSTDQKTKSPKIKNSPAVSNDKKTDSIVPAAEGNAVPDSTVNAIIDPDINTKTKSNLSTQKSLSPNINSSSSSYYSSSISPGAIVSELRASRRKTHEKNLSKP